jgi:hypothetical protein
MVLVHSPDQGQDQYGVSQGFGRSLSEGCELQ